jgi:ATP-dependent DNA helicase RecG
MTELELRELISKGEGFHLEFKEENVSNESIKKTIVCFANTDGGKILIGVRDDGTIVGVSNADRKMQDIENIAYNNCEPPVTILQETVSIEGKTIIIVNVPKGFQRPYRTNDGKYYIRSSNICRDASREELLRIFQASGSIFYDEIEVSRATFSDLDLNSFQSFLKDYLGLEINVEDNLEYYLKNFHLISDKKIPTITGILFFGKDPQKFIPQARIICAAIPGDDISIEPCDKKEITATVPNMIKNCESFFKIYLRQKHEIKDFEEEILEEIPMSALREAVVNAIAHRDYTISAPIRIIIFSDRVEIHSPGKLPNTVTIESMKVGGSHVLRNPTIYNILAKMKMVTDSGSGVRRIIKLVKEHSNKDVNLIATDNEFIVNIPRKLLCKNGLLLILM